MKKLIIRFMLAAFFVSASSGIAIADESKVKLKNEVWTMAFKQMIEKQDIILEQAAKASGEYPELVDCFGLLNMFMQLQYDGDICPPWPPWPWPPGPWPPWWLEDIQKWTEVTQPWEKPMLSNEMQEFFRNELTPRKEVVEYYMQELKQSAEYSANPNLTAEEKALWTESQQNAAGMKNDIVIENQFQ